MAGLEGTLRVRHPPGLRDLSEILLAGVSRIPVVFERPRDSSSGLPAFPVGSALVWDYMPVLFCLLTSITELLRCWNTGASPGPLLCFNGLSSPAAAVY